MTFFVSRIFLVQRELTAQSNDQISLVLNHSSPSQTMLANAPFIQEVEKPPESPILATAALNKRDRLDSDHIEALSAPDVFAAHRVIAPDHVALRLGESCPVAVIRSSRQLRFLSPHHPLNLILSLLPAVRTGHYMRTLLRPLIKKVALFHNAPRWPGPNRSSPCALFHPA
jgi:hypothetical protein